MQRDKHVFSARKVRRTRPYVESPGRGHELIMAYERIPRLFNNAREQQGSAKTLYKFHYQCLKAVHVEIQVDR